MAKELFANNAKSTLASSINGSDLSLSVASGHGARFPTITGSDYFFVTLDDGANIEIVKCTARSTDTLTIVRAQQSTSAVSFTSGAKVELRPTEQGMADLQLTVKEIDGAPSVDAVKTIRFSNGSVTDDGSGQVTVTAGGAPDSADYWVETANGSLSAEVVVGTTGITSNAYASRQASAKNGRLHFPSDGFGIGRDNGSSWAEWGPIFPFTPPVSGDFSSVNFTGSTLTTTYGGMHIQSPSNGSAQSLRLYAKTLPSSPYTITVAFMPLLQYTSFSHAMVGLRDTGTDDAVLFTVKNDGPSRQFGLETWTSNTSGGTGTYITAQNADMMPWPLIWLRIQDDNTNRKFFWSATGREDAFVELHSTTRTNFLTPNQFCFGTNPFSQITGITLLSYKET